jgi:hypothetical protein
VQQIFAYEHHVAVETCGDLHFVLEERMLPIGALSQR